MPIEDLYQAPLRNVHSCHTLRLSNQEPVQHVSCCLNYLRLAFAPLRRAFDAPCALPLCLPSVASWRSQSTNKDQGLDSMSGSSNTIAPERLQYCPLLVAHPHRSFWA